MGRQSPGKGLFSGMVVDRKPKGLGKVIIFIPSNGEPLKESYEGEWDGLPHGKGVLRLVNSITTGFFSNGVRQGIGEYIFIKEAIMINGLYTKAPIDIYQKNYYSGNFEGDKFQGKGFLDFEEVKYEGEFQGNKKHGCGTIVYPNSSKYTGEWQNDLYHGMGTLEEKKVKG